MEKIYLGLLGVIALTGCASSKDIEQQSHATRLDNIYQQQAVEKHLKEWQAVKPQIDELLELKQDLEFLIAALSQNSEREFDAQKSISPVVSQEKEEKQIENKTTVVPEGKFYVSGSGPKLGVHLASYLQMEDAQNGWAKIFRDHPSLLKEMSPKYQNVTVNGVEYISLRAGPLSSAAKGRDLCTELRKHNQYCAPSTF